MEKFFKGLEAFAGFLERQVAAHEAAVHVAADASAVTLEEKIKAVHGDSSKLASLAQSTQDERVRQGYTPNDPLERSGELRDSYEHAVEHGPGYTEAGAGSSDPRAFYHEFGYVVARTGATVPARPTVEIGLQEAKPEVEALVDEAVRVGLGFGPGLSKLVP